MITPQTRRPRRAIAALLCAALFVALFAAMYASNTAAASSVMAARESRAGRPLLLAQRAPGAGELERYTGLHAAAAKGDAGSIGRLVAAGGRVEARDGHGRTPLMVAGYGRRHAAARALIAAGADLDALDNDRYDLLTIAAVEDDIEMVRLAIAAGADTGLVTSPYDGTALIAAAHLGHVAVVRALIDGGATLDHVNNLGWTALIEAIVLGDGGKRHSAIVRALIDAGADLNLADRNGATPLALARGRGYAAMAEMLRKAGVRP